MVQVEEITCRQRKGKKEWESKKGKGRRQEMVDRDQPGRRNSPYIARQREKMSRAMGCTLASERQIL